MTDINNCPRCGRGHDNLVEHGLDIPSIIDGKAYTRWLACPVTNETIFVARIKLDKPTVPAHTHRRRYEDYTQAEKDDFWDSWQDNGP